MVKKLSHKIIKRRIKYLKKKIKELELLDNEGRY